MKSIWPPVLKENASKRDREVRVLNSALFLNGFKNNSTISMHPNRTEVCRHFGPDGAYGPAKGNGLSPAATRPLTRPDFLSLRPIRPQTSLLVSWVACKTADGHGFDFLAVYKADGSFVSVSQCRTNNKHQHFKHNGT